ncbi:hypothetical protein ACFVUW_22540 [Streptomyces xiamenensis]|uniref:hypothetical protein n=1 Tax=Streptomyces xiamenensis TaxID=408015 RepID=UPI0036E811B5
MASSKTRANVARVAAAAIFAAGASLAVVGTANATTSAKSDVTTPSGDEGDSGLISGLDVGGALGGGDEGADQGSGGDEGADAGSDEGADQGGDEGADGGSDEGADGGADEGADEGANGDADGGNGGNGDADGGNGGNGDADGGNGGSDDGGSGNGGPGPGVNEGATGNDPEPDTQGGSSPIEQNPPAEDITETVPDATTPAGETPNGERGELAETGASGGEALLIIGAATMIAGGVAFRYLPRLVNKGAAAA